MSTFHVVRRRATQDRAGSVEQRRNQAARRALALRAVKIARAVGPLARRPSGPAPPLPRPTPGAGRHEATTCSRALGRNSAGIKPRGARSRSRESR
jgi:hypothetical protein